MMLASAIEATQTPSRDKIAAAVTSMWDEPEEITVAIAEALFDRVLTHTLPPSGFRLSDLVQAAEVAWVEALIILARKQDAPTHGLKKRISHAERQKLAARIRTRRASRKREVCSG